MKLPLRLKYALKAVSNIHRQGALDNILLFATPRGGSTWVMELIASQPGMKYYDEPFNVRRDNVSRTGLFPSWDSLMPDSGDTETIVRYLNDLSRGRYRHMNPPPFRRNHRFFTNRIVFKIHELEHLVGTLAARSHSQVIYLLRHPIPTTLSRSVFPRLECFLRSPFYRQQLGAARCREIDAIVATGSHLLRGVVSWCYENFLPLVKPDFQGLVITYEELVLNPAKSCQLLVDYLRLPDAEAMQRAFDRPSANIALSSSETREVMRSADERQRRRQLVTRWKDRISRSEEADVSGILDLFEIDAYSGHSPLASCRYLHFAGTSILLEDLDPVDTRVEANAARQPVGQPSSKSA